MMKLKESPQVNKFEKYKFKTFTDNIAGRKKFIPGVGHYKDIDKALNKISKPSTAAGGSRRFR